MKSVRFSGLILALFMLLFAVQPAQAALSVYKSVTGLISVSVDGKGSVNQTYTIRANKPSSLATVRNAYLMAATVMATSDVITNTDITLAGSPVTFTTKYVGVANSYIGEVTSIVKPTLDAAAVGIKNLTVSEGTKSLTIDGTVLVVIWDDPAQTVTQSFIMLFGGQAAAGDTFAITLGTPIDPAAAGSRLDMGLGISYSYQTSAPSQYSIVKVNGTLLTSSAGGSDDGELANGALITVGGIDDTNANPASASSNGTGPRYDDELYSLLPFINKTMTSISVFTSNPSNDDNIFFAYFSTSGAAIVGEGIVLSPDTASKKPGDSHTVTATVVNTLGVPVSGKSVTFSVVSGPNTGKTGTATTNSSGIASFTYTIGATTGTDSIQATFVDSQSKTVTSNTVTATITAPAINVTVNQVVLDSCPTVKAYVTVADANGSPVTGLTSANFAVTEDGTARTPVTVTTVGNTAAASSFSMVLDYSGSMSGTPRTNLQTAATTFISQLGSTDAMEIIKFSTTVAAIQAFTSDKSLLTSAVTNSWSGQDGNTAFYDAVYMGLTDTNARSGRKAVIAMTDGVDNVSTHTIAEVTAYAVSLGIPVYTIGLGSVNSTVLQQLATATGGLYFNAPTAADLQTIYAQLTNSISNQYVVTYAGGFSDGAQHTLQVTVSTGSGSGSGTKLFTACGSSVTFTPSITYYHQRDGIVAGLTTDGSTITGGSQFYQESNAAWSIVGQGDFDGDGIRDLVWWNNRTGQVYIMLMASATTVKSGAIAYAEPNTYWRIVATGDLNGDGKTDLIWWNQVTGQVYAMLLNGTTVTGSAIIYSEPDTSWKIVAAADFDGNGKSELLWWNSRTGQVAIGSTNGTSVSSGTLIWTEANTDWRIAGAGDLDGDGKADIIWHNRSTGQVYGMQTNGSSVTNGAVIYTDPNTYWEIISVGNYNRDNKADLLWWNQLTGQVYLMTMNGLSASGGAMLYYEPDTTWNIQAETEWRDKLYGRGATTTTK
ncbi:MAG: VWA domain-containing protein [Desulfuromonadales bacterium]